MYQKTLRHYEEEPEMVTDLVDKPLPNCTRCGSGRVAAEEISTAFWAGSDLNVIRDIPALVCRACGEEFISDQTQMTLDLMRKKGFNDSAATTHMRVPVFAFGGSPVKNPDD